MPGTVVITASEGTLSGLGDALRGGGIAVEERPLLRFAPPLDWAPVDAALDHLDRFQAVAVTSPRAAQALADRVRQRALRSPPPAVWVTGQATGQALGGLLGKVRMPDARTTGELGAAAALARAMLSDGVRGPVLFPCGEIRRDELPVRLRDEGIEVEEVVCYRSVMAGEVEARAAAERAQVLVVASPSVADLLARACPPGARPALLAVGPTTAASSRASGWPPDAVATSPTADAVAAAARSLLVTR